MGRYSDSIIKTVLEANDLEDTLENRESIQQLAPDEVFDTLLNWEGIIGYTIKIKNWVKEVYDIDLDSIVDSQLETNSSNLMDKVQQNKTNLDKDKVTLEIEIERYRG